MLNKDKNLRSKNLVCGYEFSDAQMDDYQLGIWVAQQAQDSGVVIRENSEVLKLTLDGLVTLSDSVSQHDRVVNVAGPWAINLLEQSGIKCPYKLDIVRGSHLVLDQVCQKAYLLEIPNESRFFCFALEK